MPINENTYFNDPFKALSDLINTIHLERAPYLITCKFVKVESNTAVINHEGQKYRILKNRLLFIPGHKKTGDLVHADSRHLIPC